MFKRIKAWWSSRKINLGHAKNIGELEQQLQTHKEKMGYERSENQSKLPNPENLEKKAGEIAFKNLAKAAKKSAWTGNLSEVQSQSHVAASYPKTSQRLLGKEYSARDLQQMMKEKQELITISRRIQATIKQKELSSYRKELLQTKWKRVVEQAHQLTDLIAELRAEQTAGEIRRVKEA